jgi:opacity protein-like surface antigen
MNFRTILKTTVCFILLNSFPRISEAQLTDTYLDAKIILVKGDTLIGTIKENDGIRMSQGFFFKNKTFSRVFYSNEIKKMYVGKVEYDQLKLPNKDSTIVLGWKVLDGKITLHKFYHEGVINFALRKNNEFYILRDDEVVNGSQYMRRFYFKKYLKLALSDQIDDKTKYEELNFRESVIVNLVEKYNTLNGGGVKHSFPRKVSNFALAYIGYSPGKKIQEKYVQLTYRRYFPKLNKNVCLNIGLNYYDNNSTKNVTLGGKNDKYISLPVSIQLNLLSKRIRPYACGGFGLVHVLETDRFFPINYLSFKKTGIVHNLGGGVEVNVTKNILLKTETKIEVYTHLVSFALGYVLPVSSKKK